MEIRQVPVDARRSREGEVGEFSTLVCLKLTVGGWSSAGLFAIRSSLGRREACRLEERLILCTVGNQLHWYRQA